MKLNTDKCHLLMSGSKYEHFWAQIGKDRIWEDNEVKLLGITIDNSLKFDTHINNICTKANQKLSVLSRMGNILNFEQRRRIFKSYFKRPLRIVYHNDIPNFEELLKKYNSFSIHRQNIQTLAIEIYKVHYGLSENSFYDVSENSRSSYNLRSQRDLDILLSALKTTVKAH